MKTLETIGRWGYRYRHEQKDARGFLLHPDEVGEVSAKVGRAAWLRLRNELPSARHGNTFLFMGVAVREDGAAPKDGVVFEVKGVEVGRITDLSQNAGQNGN